MIPPTRYISAGPGMPLANPQAAMVEAQAYANLGQTIQQVGQVGFQYAEKIRRIDEAGKIASLEANMNEDAANFSMELMKREDTENWPGEWKERSGKWLKEAQKIGLSPEGLARFQERYTQWNSQRSIGFEVTAANKAIELGRARIANAYEYHVGQQDYESAARALQDGADAGIYSTPELEKGMLELAKQEAIDDYRARMASEPKEALRVLTDPEWHDAALDVTTRERLAKEAEAAVQDRRAAELDALEAAHLEGRLKPVDIEAAQYLTAKDMASVKRALNSTRPPDPTAHSEAWKVLFEMREKFQSPELSNENYAEQWNNARAKVLSLIPPNYQGDIKQELSYRSPANRRSGNVAEAEASDFRVLATQRIVRAFDDGLLGDVSDPKADSTKKAFTRMQDAKASVIRFIKRHPEAGWEEIQDATTKALGGILDESDDAPLIPVAPAPVSFDTRLNSWLGIPAGQADASDSLLPPR